MDEHVMNMPYFLRWFLVHKIILNKRVPKVAKRYKQIETAEGFPLDVHSRSLAKQIHQKTYLPVEVGTSYSSPSFVEALQRLKAKAVAELLVVPMFPHYAYPTYRSMEDDLRNIAFQVSSNWKVYVKKPYYNDEAYIKLLADVFAPQVNTQTDHVLFSFHSVPFSHLEKVSGRDACSKKCSKEDCSATGTCYLYQLEETVSLLSEKMNLQNYSLSFQSRFMGKKWLSPFTDKELARLGKENKSLKVITPGFVMDNLETLEELGIRGRDTFLAAGGKDYEVIHCVNNHARLASIISDWVQTENLHSPFTPLLKK